MGVLARGTVNRGEPRGGYVDLQQQTQGQHLRSIPRSDVLPESLEHVGQRAPTTDRSSTETRGHRHPKLYLLAALVSFAGGLAEMTAPSPAAAPARSATGQRKVADARNGESDRCAKRP